MAVILEIEISEPFGCRNLEQPTCDKARVDRELKEMYDLGVRSSLLLNKFDNPLAGVRFDSGPVGAVINAGNRDSAGSFWSAKTCTGPLQDNEIATYSPEIQAAINNVIATIGLQSGSAPVYPPAPHCNTRGLTPLGRHLVKRMMDLGMIVNPDHMSQAAVDDTLTLLETRKYSGVISPHGWVDPGNWPRIWKLGGVAWPGHSAADNYVKDWKDYRPRSTPYKFGWGYGADLGGLSAQPAPVEGEESITYPFKSYDGRVTFDKQTTGERTFDYREEGVAHYGLYAEWFEDLERIGGRRLAHDMHEGSEAYLQMWERATGVSGRGCMTRGGAFTKRGRGPLRVGGKWPALLRRAGQPQRRTQTWTWCVQGPSNQKRADVAVLNRARPGAAGRLQRRQSLGGGRAAHRRPREVHRPQAARQPVRAGARRSHPRRSASRSRVSRAPPCARRRRRCCAPARARSAPVTSRARPSASARAARPVARSRAPATCASTAPSRCSAWRSCNQAASSRGWRSRTASARARTSGSSASLSARSQAARQSCVRSVRASAWA